MQFPESSMSYIKLKDIVDRNTDLLYVIIFYYTTNSSQQYWFISM